MVESPVATVNLLHGWLSDLEQWRNTRAPMPCARALLRVGMRESTQRLAVGASKFLWGIKPLQPQALYERLCTNYRQHHAVKVLVAFPFP